MNSRTELCKLAKNVSTDIEQVVICVVVDLNQKCGTINVSVADIPLHRADGDRHYI